MYVCMCDYVSVCVCVYVGGRREINCLCTYRQQPEPQLTHWKIRYDSFPEKGEKKKSELPLRWRIPGTSPTSSLHRKMRECQWGLTLRHPTADQSIADIAPRHVKPLQSRVLKFCITNEVLLLLGSPPPPPPPLIIHVYQRCLYFEGWLSSHIKTLMNLISLVASSIRRFFFFLFSKWNLIFLRIQEKPELIKAILLVCLSYKKTISTACVLFYEMEMVGHGFWTRHVIFKPTVSSSLRFSKRWQIFQTGQINWLWYLAHLLLKLIRTCLPSWT